MVGLSTQEVKPSVLRMSLARTLTGRVARSESMDIFPIHGREGMSSEGRPRKGRSAQVVVETAVE